mgnify:CR=1 FL=1
MKALSISFSKIPNFILIIVLVCVVFGVYQNSLGGNFLIDDETAIVNNPKIQDIQKYFSESFSLHPGAFYETLTVFFWKMSAGKPFVFHLFAVMAHSLNAALVFILCNALFANKPLSFLSALIFAVHPINTEAVSWISGSQYAYSALFYISAVTFYILSRKHFLYLVFSVLFFALCLFTGNAAAVLPALLILCDLFFNIGGRAGFRKVKLAVLLSALCISGIFIAWYFFKKNTFIHMIFYYRGASYLVVAVKAFAYYLKILYLPLARGLFHPFAFTNFDIQRLSPAFFIGLSAMAAAVVCFFKCRRRAPAVSFGIMWFLVAYAPYSNFIPICNIISERYMYLPCVGFAIIIAALFLKVWEIINRHASLILRRLALAALTLFICSYGALTVKRNYEYNNIITFWETNINNFSSGYAVYNNLAATFYKMGNIKNAITYCWINLMVNPAQPHVWCNLGMLYRQQGQIKDAIECYQQAISIDKDYYPAHKALAEIKK